MNARALSLDPTGLDNDLWLWFKVSCETLYDRLTPAAMLQRHRTLFDGVHTCCLFVGYPRSGHSVVGSLIDAHPQALMAHRLDVLKYVAAGCDRERAFYLMMRNSERFARGGRQLTGYRYPVPGWWQGRQQGLRVLGDQEGNHTAVWLAQDPGLARRLAGSARVRILHVIRNPYDNITTWARRSQTSLDFNIERYFERCASVQRVKDALPEDQILDVRHEDFVEDFPRSHQRILSFLGLEAPPGYMEAAGALVYRRPRQSRAALTWTQTQIREVERRMAAHPFLEGYAGFLEGYAADV